MRENSFMTISEGGRAVDRAPDASQAAPGNASIEGADYNRRLTGIGRALRFRGVAQRFPPRALPAAKVHRPSTARPLPLESRPVGRPLLKLHASLPAHLNVFTSYGDGWVEVSKARHEGSILVMADRAVEEWGVASFESLAAADFERVAALDPELVLFGSGRRLRFPHPRLLAALHARGTGVETMDVHAACRTYNILLAEGRRVAAALLIGPGPA